MRTLRIILLTAVAIFTLLSSAPQAYSQPGSTFATALAISTGNYNYNIPSSGIHYYRFEAKRGQVVSLDLNIYSSDLDITLYDSSQSPLASSAEATEKKSESIRYTIKFSGFYYVKVFNALPNQGSYTLIFAFPAPGGSFTTALNILDSTYNYTIQSIQEHYYKIGVPKQMTLAASISMGATSNVDLFLYDNDQKLLSQSLRGIGSTESLQYETKVEGNHYLKVSNPTEETFTYSLTVSFAKFTVLYSGWGSPSAPEEVAAGEKSVPFTVSLRQETGYILTGLKATIILPPGFSSETGASQATTTYNQSLTAGQVAAFNFKLSTPQSAEQTAFPSTLIIEYLRNIDNTLTYENPMNMTVTIRLTGRSSLTLEASSNILRPGSNTIVFNIRNAGNAEASSISVKVNTIPPLALRGEEGEWFTASIPPSAKATREYLIYAPPTSAGSSHKISSTIQYRNAAGALKTIVIESVFNVKEAEESKLELQFDGQILVAGASSDLTVKFVNRYPNSVLSLELTLSVDAPLLILEEEGKWLITEIKAGSDHAVSAKIYAPYSTLGGSFGASITAQYKTGDGAEKTVTRRFRVTAESAAASPSLEIRLDSQSVAIGKTTNIKLVIRNTGSLPLVSVEVEANLSAPLQLIGRDNRWVLPSLPSGGETAINLPLTAAFRPERNLAEATVTLTYVVHGATRTESRVIVFNIIEGYEPLFKLTTTSQGAVTGAESILELNLTNTGTTKVYAVEVTLQPTSPLSVTGGDDHWFLQEVQASSSVLLKPRVRLPVDAETKTYVLQVTIDYRTTFGEKRSEARRIGVFATSGISKNIRFSVSADSPDLVASKTNNVVLTLKNLGESAADSINVAVQLPSDISLIGGSNKWYFSRITGGGEVRIEGKMLTSSNALGRTFPATVTLSFVDSQGNERKEELTFGLSVRGYVNLIFSDLLVRPTPVLTGQRAAVSGILVNGGIVSAKAVNVTVLPEKPFRSRVGASTIIAEIPKDGQATFNTAFDADDVADGKYTLKLQVSYLDDRGVKEDRTFSYEVDVARQPLIALPKGPTAQSGSLLPLDPMLTLLLGFAAGLGAMAAVRRRRRRIPFAK